MTTATARGRRAEMVAALTECGAVTDPAWAAAFAAVPRETFVPRYFLPRMDAPGWRLVEGDNEWCTGVYTDAALVTQMGGDEAAVEIARRGERVEGAPTSSSSAPTLMARMLDALDVRVGDRVLEIGTGSGYNAALLAHRVGDQRVTTVEVDPALTELARTRLESAGYRPTVVCGDGAAGYTPGAPYDRLVATVALPAVPSAWLGQTGPGAVLVVPLICSGHAGLMTRLVRGVDGGAAGRFLEQNGWFMPVREVHEPPPPRLDEDDLLGALAPTDVPIGAVTGDHPAGFYMALVAPPYSDLGFTPSTPGARPERWGRGADGSRFVLTTDEDGTTLAAGDGPLWATLEAAWADWTRLGRPTRDESGLSVAPDGRHTVWLRTPDRPIIGY